MRKEVDRVGMRKGEDEEEIHFKGGKCVGESETGEKRESRDERKAMRICTWGELA